MDNPHVNAMLGKLNDLFSSQGIGTVAGFKGYLQTQAILSLITNFGTMLLLFAIAAFFAAWCVRNMERWRKHEEYKTLLHSRRWGADDSRLPEPVPEPDHPEGLHIFFGIVSVISLLFGAINLILLLRLPTWATALSPDYAIMRLVANKLGM